MRSRGKTMVFAAWLMLAGGPVLAQSDPSADSIINALRPPMATRGIQPLGPAEVSAPPAINLTVQFGNDSARLTPEAMHTLDALGTALTSDVLARYRFRIEGHTDALGTREHNRALSEARAKAVVEYLGSRYHVDAARLEPVGMGQDRPLVPARANVAEPRNRRVTVVNIGT